MSSDDLLTAIGRYTDGTTITLLDSDAQEIIDNLAAAPPPTPGSTTDGISTSFLLAQDSKAWQAGTCIIAIPSIGVGTITGPVRVHARLEGAIAGWGVVGQLNDGANIDLTLGIIERVALPKCSRIDVSWPTPNPAINVTVYLAAEAYR